MERVRGVVQHYAWGDPSSIPELLGIEPDGRPWAELWFGTHAGGPAMLGGGRPLTSVSGALPYLLKLLAAAQPLSLQTHPDLVRAREGFDREEASGRALDAFDRIYRDANAKPELLVALTPFDALCGFSSDAATDELLETIDVPRLRDARRRGGRAGAVGAVLRGEIDLAEAVAACSASERREAQLVCDLARMYPDDPSVLIALFLNHVRLAPGEAVFLGAGNLHAYLRGSGVEIMGASDNVVRGGLTTKHVDVDELLAVVDFAPLPDPVVHPAEIEPGTWCYDTPGTPFRLWRFDVDGRVDHVATGRELLLCTAGDVSPLARGTAAYLARGESVALTGVGTVFRVEEIAP